MATLVAVTTCYGNPPASARTKFRRRLATPTGCARVTFAFE